MITLKEVTENEKNTLWNINQKYLYEMTQYYPDEMEITITAILIVILQRQKEKHILYLTIPY